VWSSAPTEQLFLHGPANHLGCRDRRHIGGSARVLFDLFPSLSTPFGVAGAA
jgi:hypothetical protein